MFLRKFLVPTPKISRPCLIACQGKHGKKFDLRGKISRLKRASLTVGPGPGIPPKLHVFHTSSIDAPTAALTSSLAPCTLSPFLLSVSSSFKLARAAWKTNFRGGRSSFVWIRNVFLPHTHRRARTARLTPRSHSNWHRASIRGVRRAPSYVHAASAARHCLPTCFCAPASRDMPCGSGGDGC